METEKKSKDGKSCSFSVKHSRLLLCVLVAVFILKGMAYAGYIVPLTFGTTSDDVGHMSYIQYMVEEKKLPVLHETPLNKELASPERDFALTESERMTRTIDACFEENQPMNWIAQHPPLYYLLVAPIYAITLCFTQRYAIALFVLRLATLAMGVAALLLVARTLECLGCHKRIAQCILCAFVFSPAVQFCFVSIGNDGLLIMLCVAALCFLTKYQIRKRRIDFYTFAACCGAIIITKYTGALAVVGLALWWLVTSVQDDGWKNTIELMIRGGALGLIIIAPVLIRNMMLQGALFPISDNNTKEYEYSFFQFVFLSGYMEQIVWHIIGLFGWIHMADIPRNSFIFVMTIVAGSAFLGASRKLSIRKGIGVMLLAATAAVALKVGVKWPLGVGLIVVSVLVIAAVGMVPEKCEPIRTNRQNMFMILVSVIVFVGFLTAHYGIYLHRGIPGATHGRYYYIALLPGVYMILNNYRYLPNKALRCLPYIFSICLIVLECEAIQVMCQVWK